MSVSPDVLETSPSRYLGPTTYPARGRYENIGLINDSVSRMFMTTEAMTDESRGPYQAQHTLTHFVSVASSSGYCNHGCVVDDNADTLRRGTTKSYTAKRVREEAGSKPKVDVISFPNL